MKKEKKNNRKSYYLVDAVMVRVFLVVLIVCAVLAAIPMLRPSYSDIEKRELKKFPKFTFSSLVSGEYFDNINLWYADTFPLRDDFVSLNGIFKGTFGVDNDVEIHGDLGIADEIPDVQELESEDTSSVVTEVSSSVSSSEPSVASSETVNSVNSQASSAVSSSFSVL